MPYETDQRLKSYLDTNQLHREQMCRAVLAIDKRFTDVRPRHPRGGKDGGRDIEAIYSGNLKAYGAVGFVNQANDSKEQKKQIISKFKSDLTSALRSEPKPEVFIFLTNLNLTISEKNELIKIAKESNFIYCDILDRERIRIALDSADGFSIRFQYLMIPLSETEQASFFAKWGDDIQSVISSGFQRIEKTLHRLLFLQESIDAMSHLTISFELEREFEAEEIGHFRAFCSLFLKEPKHKILRIEFGSSDKSGRMTGYNNFTEQKSGIKYGISTGEWEGYFSEESDLSSEDKLKELKLVGSGSSMGIEKTKFISITYSHDIFIRFFPRITLRDLDEAMLIFLLNKKLAAIINKIHIYSNGYKIQEFSRSEFYIDYENFEPEIPVSFSNEELEDPWVRIRPNSASAFHISFDNQTPIRLFESK